MKVLNKDGEWEEYKYKKIKKLEPVTDKPMIHLPGGNIVAIDGFWWVVEDE